MATFILVMSLWSDSGLYAVDVYDSGLSGEACIEKLIRLDVFAQSIGGIASCEVDHAGEY